MESSNICRTAIGISIQASKLMGRPHVYLKFTTLNERFNVLDTAHQDLTEIPNIGYYSIGRGAHRMFVDKEGVPIPDPISHETTNTSLYTPMPFVLRELNNDLPESRRALYALRRKENHGGKEYWAYYLKRLNFEKVAPEIFHDITKDGTTTSKPFVYTNDNLNPTPKELPEEGVVASSAEIIRISSKVAIVFDETDVAEYLNATRIKYGSEKSAIISELAICSGVDKEVQVPGQSGGSTLMKEAIGVQVVTFISTFISVSTQRSGFIHEYEIGEGEPLLTGGDSIVTRFAPGVVPSTAAPSLAGTVYDAGPRGAAASVIGGP